MKRLCWLLLLCCTAGCGDAPAPSGTGAPAAAAVATTPRSPDAASIRIEVEGLCSEAERIMDAMFLAEWPVGEVTPALEASRRELAAQLADIDRQIAAKLPQLAPLRNDPETQREAAIWRQRVASSEANEAQTTPLVAELVKAAERYIAEVDKSQVSEKTAENAKLAALTEAKDAKKKLATVQLQLQKERRRLSLYQ